MMLDHGGRYLIPESNVNFPQVHRVNRIQRHLSDRDVKQVHPIKI